MTPLGGNIVTPPQVCACGKRFTFKFESALQGKHTLLPANQPQVIAHCREGKSIVVPGQLTAFFEIIDGNLVEAKPVLRDLLED